MTDLAALSARALARAIREKKVSSVEATTAAIKRMKDCHELTNCIVTLEADEALAAAKAADAAVAKGSARGALTGVPLAHKDMFDRKGKIASWGAKIRADRAGGPGLHGDCPLQGLGRAADRGAASRRVRLRPDRAQLRHRPRPQSLGHLAHHRRLLRWNGSQCRLRRDPGRPRLRHRRLAAAAGRVLRHRLHQADLGPHQPRRRHAALARARHRRRARPARGGPGAGLGRSRRPRSPAIPRPRALPVPDYLSHLDDPVKGLKVGVDEAVIGEASPEVQRMVQDVLAVLGKVGLAKASCRFPDWQTLDHLVQLVQLPDASAAHTAYLRTRPGRLQPAGAIARRGRPLHRRRRPPDGAARARHLPAAHARSRPSREPTSPSCRSWRTRCRRSRSSTSPPARTCRRPWAGW